jgi:hypothetical protein
LGKLDLIGLLVSLKLLARIGGFEFKKQKEMAKLIGLSEPTFIKKRRELEELKLLEIHDEGNKRTMHLKFLSRLKFFKLPKGLPQQLDYLDKSAKSLSLVSEETGQLPLKSNIYNINSTEKDIIDNKVSITKFSKEDYTIVLNAYEKYKGVGLFGPEIKQHLRAIKMMFLASRKPNEIVKFMEWLHNNENNPETSWVRNWTIWTVQKKIPEFLAGKLKGEVEESEPL